MKMVPLLNPIKPRANPGGTKFEKYNGDLNVYYNGVFVASIEKMDAKRLHDAGMYDTPPHYAVNYKSGRISRFDTLAEAKDDARKITPRAVNPLRKRAARKTKTIQRAGLAREAYVKRPSQMTGTKPTKRLVARRAVAKRKGTFPNPGITYYVQLVRAPNDASGNPRKLAIVYDADGVRVDAVPYAYGTYEDDFKRLGYSHHIAMQYQIEITPKEFNWLKGAKRINNPEKSGVVTFHAFNVITRGNGKIQVHDGANTQPAACAIAEALQKKLGSQKVYVASRAYIKKHTGA